uniref:TLC domain-containing protein n=1 Tax=Phasianus colchicus TaxID=9054 RepID=A0A669QQI2_PHACC
DLISVAKQSGLPVRTVQTWFRHRRAQDHPRLTKRFCEASWRFTFYFTSFFSGVTLLYDQGLSCCLLFVSQPLLPALGWFYLLELSFYCSLVVTLPFDVKRKDFKEQIIHHIATITLIFVSYCANLIRLGVMIMLVHDASDYLLELAKVLHYMKWKRVCEAVFIVFAVVFISSRLVIFPLITYHYYVTKFEMFFLSCLINAFLVILQLLHIFWSYLILRMTFGVILYGAVRKIFFSSMTTRSSMVLHTCKERVGKKGAAQPNSPRTSELKSRAEGCMDIQQTATKIVRG